MDRHEKDSLDRWLTTDPLNQERTDMEFQEELENLCDAAESIQRAIAELEYENDQLSQIAENTLNNGWDKMQATVVGMKYRLQQVQLRYNDIGNALEELKTQIGAIS